METTKMSCRELIDFLKIAVHPNDGILLICKQKDFNAQDKVHET